jgi:uncharacterized membrane protein
MRSLPFAAPVHTIFVHYTIALASASFVFDTLGFVLHDEGLAMAGWWTLALSVVVTVATLASGLASRLRLDIGEGPARSFLRLHMALGPTLFGMLVATAVWRGTLWRANTPVGWWYLTALALTAAVLTVQGYAGGELVYRWGVMVEGRHSNLRQRRARDARPAWPLVKVLADQAMREKRE